MDLTNSSDFLPYWRRYDQVLKNSTFLDHIFESKLLKKDINPLISTTDNIINAAKTLPDFQ